MALMKDGDGRVTGLTPAILDDLTLDQLFLYFVDPEEEQRGTYSEAMTSLNSYWDSIAEKAKAEGLTPQEYHDRERKGAE